MLDIRPEKLIVSLTLIIIEYINYRYFSGGGTTGSSKPSSKAAEILKKIKDAIFG